MRTSAVAVTHYDGPTVARTIERDIREHGAPLAYRLDRASCHRVDEVDEVLDGAGVLRLHGPPHHPRFYGQLERQNREHREWLGWCPELDEDDLEAELALMCRSLNGVRPRPMLAFRTAEDMWQQRRSLEEDRSALRQAVLERAARIGRGADTSLVRGSVEDFAQRIAIEQELTQRGYLHCQLGGWC